MSSEARAKIAKAREKIAKIIPFTAAISSASRIGRGSGGRHPAHNDNKGKGPRKPKNPRATKDDKDGDGIAHEKDQKRPGSKAEAKAQVAAHWKAGLSASQIADKTGLTRNEVIQHVHRSGLSTPRAPKGTGNYHRDPHQRRVVDAMSRGASRSDAELQARLNGKIPGQQEPTPKGYKSAETLAAQKPSKKALLPNKSGQRAIERAARATASEDRQMASQQRAVLADVPLHRKKDGIFRSGADQTAELNRSISYRNERSARMQMLADYLRRRGKRPRVSKIRKAAPKTLYVYRPVVNADEIIAWAQSQGFGSTLKAEDMHVTVAWSKKPMNWAVLSDDYRCEPMPNDERAGLCAPISYNDGGNKLRRITGGPREVKALGDKGAVVLAFQSTSLTERWAEFIRLGATYKFPGYTPHITITYDGAGVDLDDVEPFTGDIVLGEEHWNEIDENWNAKFEETGDEPDDEIVEVAEVEKGKRGSDGDKDGILNEAQNRKGKARGLLANAGQLRSKAKQVAREARSTQFDTAHRAESYTRSSKFDKPKDSGTIWRADKDVAVMNAAAARRAASVAERAERVSAYLQDRKARGKSGLLAPKPSKQVDPAQNTKDVLREVRETMRARVRTGLEVEAPNDIAQRRALVDSEVSRMNRSRRKGVYKSADVAIRAEEMIVKARKGQGKGRDGDGDGILNEAANRKKGGKGLLSSSSKIERKFEAKAFRNDLKKPLMNVAGWGAMAAGQPGIGLPIIAAAMNMSDGSKRSERLRDAASYLRNRKAGATMGFSHEKVKAAHNRFDAAMATMRDARVNGRHKEYEAASARADAALKEANDRLMVRRRTGVYKSTARSQLRAAAEALRAVS